MIREDIQKAADEYSWRGDMYDLKSAFIAGAEFIMKRVWHDSSEVPSLNYLLLIELISNKYDLCYWVDCKDKMRVRRWCYVNDLINLK